MSRDITIKPEATLTIKQMAAQSGISEYTLRYYEKIGLIEPVPRDGSSGHRRYSAATIQTVEALSCLRVCGLSLDEMRLYLRLLERGEKAAAEQKALFLAHAEEVADEIRRLEIRQRYLHSKVACWDAVLNGDMKLAEQIATQNQEIAKESKQASRGGMEGHENLGSHPGNSTPCSPKTDPLLSLPMPTSPTQIVSRKETILSAHRELLSRFNCHETPNLSATQPNFSLNGYATSGIRTAPP